MRPSLIAGVVAVSVLVTGARALRRSVPAGPGTPESARMVIARERLIRDQDISFFRGRIARDPSAAIDRVRLGGLLLRRARETGEEADFLAAEMLARESLANRKNRNGAAWQLLEAALMDQHRFVEALEAARELVAAEPDGSAPAAILGEVLLELGEYLEADALFRHLTPRRYEAAVAPRYARWLELRGHAGLARRLLEVSRDEVTGQAETTPAAQRSWYELRLGELALRFGALPEARHRLDTGLALVPDDWRLLAARARLALAEGDPGSAVQYGDSSLARHLDPATLAMVGDAWRARGDTAMAEEYYRAMEASTRAPRGGFHRVWYLALLDHDRRIPQILTAVQRDLDTRHDVYGYDLLAWALFKSGRIQEARSAMTQALAWETEDPQLRAHAKAIGKQP